MLLTGTLREYPFSLLLEIFLHRQETGLLEISSSKISGYFYIRNGKVKDGQLGKNHGFAAVKVVQKFEDGSFRFRRLEPADYARVVWQRRFGPTRLAAGESGRSAGLIANELRNFRSLVVVAFHHAQTVERFVIQRTTAYAIAALAFWKRAQVGTKVRRFMDKALATRPNMSRRSRRVEPAHSCRLSFYTPSPISNSRAAIASALQQGVDHNVIFAITVTVLLGVSGLCVHQLVSGDQQSIDTRIGIDQHFDTSANVTPNNTKPKRSTNKRRSTRRLRDKSTDSKRGVRPPQETNAAPKQPREEFLIAPN